MNYYNENDPRAAAWLRELVSNGLIPPGHVDDRSIAEVKPSDLVGYTQCHFFAGIGGWSYALQLAGWPTDRPIWTASCPCQPFSVAGKGLGTDDERHLWPVVANLVRQCNPPIVIGEQVASKAGREWLTGVFTDLEGMAYAVAGADLCAAGVGAPHIRQRLYWVANSKYHGHDQQGWDAPKQDGNWAGNWIPIGGCDQLCKTSRVGNARCSSDERRGEFGVMGQATSQEQGEAREWQRCWNADCHSMQDHHGLVQSNGNGCQQGSPTATPTGHGHSLEPASSWSESQLVQCRDGKTRRTPTEPAFLPLAHGVPARVVRLRGYGNAIVPQVAATFIQAISDHARLL